MDKNKTHIIRFLAICAALSLWTIACRLMFGGQAPAYITEKWQVPDAFSAFSGRPGEYGVYKGRLDKTINRYGFISTPDLTVAKPDGTIRIAFLGGSSTAGTGPGLADRDTWPWRVTEMVKAAFPGRHIDFINGALPKYTTFESYGRLWSRIRFFKPDIICVYHGWSEMGYFTADKIDSITSWRDGGGMPAGRPVSKALDKRGLEIFRGNLDLIKMAAGLIGAKLFVCKEATLAVGGLSPAEQKRCRYDYHGFGHEAHVAAFKDIYAVIDREIDPGSVIDVTPVSGVPGYFMDHVHPTVQGSGKIAEIVSKKIISWIHLNCKRR